MDAQQISIARRCLDGAIANSMTFPEIVMTLMEAGFESYTVDFRRGVATYFLQSGTSTELRTAHTATAVAPSFDARAIEVAIREAQQLVPGYTYDGFCTKAMVAGCVGYMVSFSGRRAVYFGRTGDLHVEHFPSAA